MIDVCGLFSWHLTMAFYTTRHWQTPGRLVQKLNVCTVDIRKEKWTNTLTLDLSRVLCTHPYKLVSWIVSQSYGELGELCMIRDGGPIGHTNVCARYVPYLEHVIWIREKMGVVYYRTLRAVKIYYINTKNNNWKYNKETSNLCYVQFVFFFWEKISDQVMYVNGRRCHMYITIDKIGNICETLYICDICSVIFLYGYMFIYL